jgi:hypothetical protein
MGLTRPTATQLNTIITSISDPLSVLNKGSTAANLDIGFILNRDGGTSSNVALFWDESANSFVVAFTTDSGVNNSNVSIGEYANLRVKSIEGNISSSAQTNITSLGNLTSLQASGNISTTGYFLGNGSLLSGIIASGSGVSISSSNTAPISPTVGDFWYDTDEDILFQYIDDGASNVWVDLTSDPVTTVAGNTNKNLYAGKVAVSNTATLVDTVTVSGNSSVNWTLTSTDNANSNYKSSIVNSVNNGANVYYTEYAVILSNANATVATFTSNITSGNINLYALGQSSNVTVAFQRSLLGASTINGYFLSGATGATGIQGPAGNITDTGLQITLSNTNVASSSLAGALVISNGGLGVNGNAHITTVYSFGIGVEGDINVEARDNTYGNITANGNITTSSYFLGNGSQLTGIVTGSSYGNTEVATYLTTYTGNLSAGATTVSGNLTVGGNLIVNGNTTVINANNLSINDSMIYLAEENPADTLDIGFTAHVVNPSLNHVGFVRDATDSTWKLFSNVATQPTTTVDFTGAIYSNLQIGNLIANNVGGTLTTASQTNITAVGNLTSLSSSGNISTSGYFLGNAALLTGLPSSYGNTQVAAYLPTYSGVLGSSNLQVTGGGTFTGTLTIGAGGFINSAGNIISGGNISDSKGDVRAAPINSQAGSYTVLATDAGKTIVASFSTAAITFNASVLVAGDMVSVINTSAGTITLVQGASVTLRLAGSATTGTRTLASNGLATVICTVGGATPTFYCSGAGLT